ncbi:MAG TPA: UGSC family (seleno)protein [Gammaproteobacteria bacterium]
MTDARLSARDNGVPPLRAVGLPSETYYRYRGNVEEVRPVVAAAFEEIVAAWTRPRTEEETNPKADQGAPVPRLIEVTGADYADAAENVNELFLANHWADGLPIIPPTEQAVEAMLKGTRRPRSEILGLVAPRNGVATVEKVAINAVMAGAKPEYLPVILAAIEGFTDPDFDVTHMQTSTGSFEAAIIVSGPIAKELNFNSGMGLLGHGWRANSTVGRAVRLSLLNLGQTWPGENDMGLLGRRAAYTLITFAENNDSSPWPPYHTSRGFAAEDSTVTVSVVGGVTALGPYATVAAWSPQRVLDAAVQQLSTIGTYLGGVYAAKRIVVLTPDSAAELAAMGYTPETLREYLYEKSRVPFERLSANARRELRRMLDDHQFKPDRAPVFEAALQEGGLIPALPSPDDIHIVVAGGSPGQAFLMGYSGPNFAHQTKKVTHATMTEAGR